MLQGDLAESSQGANAGFLNRCRAHKRKSRSGTAKWASKDSQAPGTGFGPNGNSLRWFQESIYGPSGQKCLFSCQGGIPVALREVGLLSTYSATRLRRLCSWMKGNQ